MRTGPGTALDGKPKWDVSKVNQAYLNRLRDRVQQFRENGIYVSFMFFRGIIRREHLPVGTRLAGLTYDDYNATSHARCLELQTLNDIDNVIWEIANEAQPESYPWQQHPADYVRSYESGKPTSAHPKDNVRLYATTADWISPRGSERLRREPRPDSK